MENQKVKAVVCRGFVFPIPYNFSFFHVSRVVEAIFNQILIRYVWQDFDGRNDFYQAYQKFLTLCGWTEESYDREVLNRIDQVW